MKGKVYISFWCLCIRYTLHSGQPLCFIYRSRTRFGFAHRSFRCTWLRWRRIRGDRLRWTRAVRFVETWSNNARFSFSALRTTKPLEIHHSSARVNLATLILWTLFNYRLTIDESIPPVFPPQDDDDDDSVSASAAATPASNDNFAVSSCCYKAIDRLQPGDWRSMNASTTNLSSATGSKSKTRRKRKPFCVEPDELGLSISSSTGWVDQ